MAAPRPESEKRKLAAAMAGGRTIRQWTRENDVPERTAYRWARDPELLARVEAIRRRALDRSIGRAARRLAVADDIIFNLAKDAQSEAVRLAAARSIKADMLTTCQWTDRLAELERRLTELEETTPDGTGEDQAEAPRG